jgi:hypothetical protein
MNDFNYKLLEKKPIRFVNKNPSEDSVVFS